MISEMEYTKQIRVSNFACRTQRPFWCRLVSSAASKRYTCQTNWCIAKIYIYIYLTPPPPLQLYEFRSRQEVRPPKRISAFHSISRCQHGYCVWSGKINTPSDDCLPASTNVAIPGNPCGPYNTAAFLRSLLTPPSISF